MNKILFFIISISLGLTFSLPAFSLAAQIDSAPTRGLVGYWSFDEGTSTIAHDYSGNKNNGTLVGTPKPSWVAGKNGKALILNDATQYVDAGTGNTGVYNPGQTFTLSVWVLPTATGKASGADIIQKQTGSASPYASWSLDFSNNQEFGLGLGGTNNTFYDFRAKTPAVALNQWYHVVATYDGTTIKTYLNGALSNSEVFPLTIKYTSDKLVFGSWSYGQATNLFVGKIDEARIYNRALTAGEISALYQTSATKINPAPPINKAGLNAGLIAYWTMDTQDINWTTSRMIDKSGSGNTGTLGAFTSTASALGKLGQTLKFNGTSNYLVNSQVVNITKSTVSAWVNLPSYPTSGSLGMLAGFAQGNNSDTHDKDLFIDGSGKAYYYTYTGQLKCTTEPTNAIPRNSWHLVTGTNDGVNNYLYIDGQLAGSVSAGNSYAGYGSANLLVGGKVNYSGSVGCGTGNTTRTYLPANTKIDDVRIYNRALSASEVKTLYNQSQGTKVNAPPTLKPLGLDSGLVGYWTMNNQDINWKTMTMVDKSGKGNTGTLTNMPTSTSPVAGKIGQALKFNGSSYVDTNSASLGLTNSSDLTVSVWFKRADSDVGQHHLVSDYNKNTPTGWMFMFESNYLWIKNYQTSAVNARMSASVSTIIDTKWHHAVGIIKGDGTDTKLYIDGILQGSSFFGGAGGIVTQLNMGSGNVTIGRQSLPSERFFNGSIDDTRIYNRTLTPAEVLQLYRQGK